MARLRLHVCAEPGCPELSERPRCPAHTRQVDKARGTRQQRGYGRVHSQARARLLATWIPGMPCPKCKAPQWNPDLLDAGHSVDLRTSPDAVADQLECRPCNRGWRRGQ